MQLYANKLFYFYQQQFEIFNFANRIINAILENINMTRLKDAAILGTFKVNLIIK